MCEVAIKAAKETSLGGGAACLLDYYINYLYSDSIS